MTTALSGGKPARIPALDGLRACSIGLVLVAHLGGTSGFLTNRTTHIAGDLGSLGVRVFFVISGYLITSLLRNEATRNGSVSLTAFYVRRSFRILPPFCMYLTVVAVACAAGAISLRPGDFAHAATFTMNYHAERSWYVGHLWSLSVEEQFYLLWPAAFVLLRRKSSGLAAAAFLAAPAVRVAAYLLSPGSRDGIGETFPTVMDAIAAGCLLATTLDALKASARYESLRQSTFWIPILCATLVAANVLRPYPSFSMAFGESVMNAAAALLVDACVRTEGRFARAFLNLPPLVWVGQLSYSLYLYQQLFLNRRAASLLTTFPVNLTLAIVAAMVSFYLIERPAMRIGRNAVRWIPCNRGRLTSMSIQQNRWNEASS
jgi:peptidoglycan/LPS O-acetylase OafA/YrhL